MVVVVVVVVVLVRQRSGHIIPMNSQSSIVPYDDVRGAPAAGALSVRTQGHEDDEGEQAGTHRTKSRHRGRPPQGLALLAKIRLALAGSIRLVRR